jgi:hypothetical protein
MWANHTVPDKGEISGGGGSGPGPWGSMWANHVGTLGGRRFFLLLVDDATRYMWINLITTKSDATSTIKLVKAVVECCPTNTLNSKG